MNINIQLYIELLEKEVMRLRGVEADLSANKGRQGAVANLLGVNEKDVSEASRLVDETFNVQRSQQAIRSSITKDGH